MLKPFCRSVMKRFFLVLCILLMSFPTFAQGWEFNYGISSVTAAGNSVLLPFWARTVQGGYMPDVASTILIGGGDVMYTAGNGIYIGAGANLAGGVLAGNRRAHAKVSGLVDKLYISAGWRFLHADIGHGKSPF